MVQSWLKKKKGKQRNEDWIGKGKEKEIRTNKRNNKRQLLNRQ